MFTVENDDDVTADKYLSYPFKEMAVKQFFTFGPEHYSKISSAKSHLKKRTGKAFQIRKQADGQFRCTRTK